VGKKKGRRGNAGFKFIGKEEISAGRKIPVSDTLRGKRGEEGRMRGNYQPTVTFSPS